MHLPNRESCCYLFQGLFTCRCLTACTCGIPLQITVLPHSQVSLLLMPAAITHSQHSASYELSSKHLICCLLNLLLTVLFHCLSITAPFCCQCKYAIAPIIPWAQALQTPVYTQYTNAAMPANSSIVSTLSQHAHTNRK